MRIAHIVPCELVHVLPAESDTHMVISHLAVRYPTYAAYYRRQASLGKCVIMDNPVHEDGPYDPSMFIAGALVVEPTIAVLPDAIDDPTETVKRAVESLSLLENLPRQPHLMVVPHGETTEDFIECARELLRYTDAQWIGVSLERRLKDDPLALARRRERIEKLIADPAFDQRHIHLLGLSEGSTELNDPFFQQTCTSVDTSKFVVWSLIGRSQYPPVPITESYPGRNALGGTAAFFEWPVNLSSTERLKLTANLLTWTRYAEGNDE